MRTRTERTMPAPAVMLERNASDMIAARFIRAVQSRLTLGPNRFLNACSSLVHVGANTGQERALYDRYGLAVTWIEPIPALYQELVKNIQPYPRQVAIQARPSQRYLARGLLYRLSANEDGYPRWAFGARYRPLAHRRSRPRYARLRTNGSSGDPRRCCARRNT